ncbi:FmdB family zinc ribbon protein [Thermodesulfobacterium hydrogeniphilum]|uniref:FmdB family zinc ribbon protein n=1 Tax=Thermodesulfobacterium hydrogeniphilum TaxID=161156 RepID=UPI000571C16C|nr:zinc ribbon domain-containing protein [Thermodesulfobacterium hydrogeniphilum]
MPIYEFQCEECGEIFEELIFGNDFEGIVCKKCKSPKVKKLISRTSPKTSSGSGSSCSGCKGGSCSTCH